MKFIICSKCHALVRPTQTICPLCQHSQSEPTTHYTFCKRDGTPVVIATGFCPTCGSAAASIASARTKWVWALTLAFLFALLLIALPPSFTLLHDTLNTTYQPLTCRLNKGYVTTSGSHDSFYSPFFDYDVLSPQGSILASGSGDMGPRCIQYSGRGPARLTTVSDWEHVSMLVPVFVAGLYTCHVTTAFFGRYPERSQLDNG